MESGSPSHPGPHLGMLVGAVVVENQMNVHVHGNGLIDLAQKAQALLVAMAWLALGDHLAGGHIQRREEGCGAVANDVVGDALDLLQAHGKQRLSPVQRLNLRLLFNAEHNRLVGRIQVEANNVADLFKKNGSVESLKCFSR